MKFRAFLAVYLVYMSGTVALWSHTRLLLAWALAFAAVMAVDYRAERQKP